MTGVQTCALPIWEAIVVVQKPVVNNYVETLLKNGIGLFHAGNEDGSFQSNIFENIPRDKDEQENIHCTVKPLALMEKLIELFVPPSENHLVLDPFAGSGTTLVAAKKAGCSYLGIEIVPEYVEIAKKRLSESNVQPPRKKKPRTNAVPYTPTLWFGDSA